MPMKPGGAKTFKATMSVVLASWVLGAGACSSSEKPAGSDDEKPPAFDCWEWKDVNEPNLMGCICAAPDDSDDPRFGPAECSPVTQADHGYGDGVAIACCADPSWPDSGFCNCKPFGCLSGAADCSCHVLFGGEVSDAAECLPTAGQVCCQGSKSCSCSSTACQSGSTEVSSCRSVAVADSICDVGKRVDQCSPTAGSGSAPSDPRPPGCPAKAYTSCLSAADCPCTGYCGRITSNDSTKYCTIECTTDADCVSTPNFKVGGGGCNPLTFTCLPG